MTINNYSSIVKRSLGQDEKVKSVFSLSKIYLNIKMIIAFIKWAIFLALITIVLMLVQENMPEFFNFNRDLNPVYNFSENIAVNDSGSFNFLNLKNGQNINFIEIAIMTYIFIIIPLILFYYLFYLKVSNEFVFTTDRVLIKKGWIGTKTISAKFSRITDVNVSQSLIERILKTGTISINTAGSEGYEVILKHVATPYNLKKDLHNLKERYIQENYGRSFAMSRNA
ncbi:MAG: PH domain-containing protein [Patescibacteria group bacterium]|jgi:membrane protein YdbS with pleckstrin-like domain|nr:PH domain-containing protein [Patescibacteria group bacterium]